MHIAQDILSFILNFAPTLLVSELVVCFFQKRRRYFWMIFPVLFLAFVILFNSAVDFTKPLYRVLDHVGGLTYVILHLISCLLLFACFRINLSKALYIGAIGYTVEHLIHNTKGLFRTLFFQDSPVVTYLVAALCIELAVLGFIWFLQAKKIFRVASYSAGLNLMIAAITVALVGVLSYYVSSVTMTVYIYIYGFTLCSALLALQLLLSHAVDSEREKETFKQLLAASEKQREMTKENIDIINHKCHDLKHQISALEKLDNVNERHEAIKELKKAIMFYESVVKSGNSTLDIILTDKSLVCSEQEITFTYIVDASKMSFIEDMDLYVLFGNAIDNAIEAVKNLEKELRVITLNISGNDKYLKINMDNYMEGRVAFSEGLPQTTKVKNGYHGFGMRSMKYIVDKYNGHLVVRQEDNVFNMHIIFPLPKHMAGKA